MYWAVWSGSGGPSSRIETARLDGSARRVAVIGDLHWPSGLTLSADGVYLYWCDTFLDKIERLELATGARQPVGARPDVHMLRPYGLALYDGALIWSEHDTGLVRRLGRDGEVTTLLALAPPLYEMRLVSAAARGGRNACSFANGGCRELCLGARGAEGPVCACATGRALLPDGVSCAPLGAAAATPEPPAAPPCPAGRFHCGRG